MASTTKNNKAHDIEKMKWGREKVIQNFEKSDVPMLGPHSKRQYAVRQLSKQLKQLVQLWEVTDSSNVVKFDRCRKNLCSLSKECIKLLKKYSNSTKDLTTKQKHEVYNALGDFSRYIAVTMLLNTQQVTDSESRFASWAVESLTNYDKAQLSLPEYDVKVRSMFRFKVFFAYFTNLRRLNIALNKLDAYNQESSIHVEHTCAEIQQMQVSEDALDEPMLIVKTLMQVSVSVFHYIKLRVRDSRALDKVLKAIRKDWDQIDKLSPHLAHTVAITVAMLARVFVMATNEAPMGLSLLLKANAVRDAVKFDIISEERPKQWNEITTYFIENTLLGNYSLIESLRSLNARPAQFQR